MDINYFNSEDHINKQCFKIEHLMHRRINKQKIKEMNIYLFNRYYRLKPNNISDRLFLERLSIKSIYDVCDKVIEEERLKGRPIKRIYQNEQRINQNPLTNPQPKVMQNNTNQAIGVNGEQINMQFNRIPQLQQNNPPVQPGNYQSMLRELNASSERPNEEEIMSQIKEPKDWQNPRKARDRNGQNAEQLQTPINPQTLQPNQQPPQTINNNQMMNNQVMNNQVMNNQMINNQINNQSNNQLNNQLNPALSEGEGFDMNGNFGGLLEGISKEEMDKFNNANGKVQTSLSYNASV